MRDDQDSDSKVQTRLVPGVLVPLALLAVAGVPLWYLGTEHGEMLELARFYTSPGGLFVVTDPDHIRQGLRLDNLFAAAYGIALMAACVLPSRRLVGYRWAGRVLACFAAAGALADLVENQALSVILDQRGANPEPVFTADSWLRTLVSDEAAVVRLRYAYWAKYALLAVPLVFAIAVVAAWAAGRTSRVHIGSRTFARAVLDAQQNRNGWGAPRFHLHQESEKPPLWQWLFANKAAKTHLNPPATVPRGGEEGKETVVGICFSGGGIRSAAYNLGVLQELQAAGVLGRADYLAAVSGGSYIASAYSLVATCSEEGTLDDAPPFSPGSPEEQYLRNRTNYLVPGVLGFGAAMWRLTRGLLINVGFIALLLFVVARPYGWLLQDRMVAELGTRCPAPGATPPTTMQPPPTVPIGLWQEAPDERGQSCRNVEFRTTAWAGWLVGGAAGLALVVGLADLVLRPRERSARRFERWSFRFLMIAVAGGLLFFVLPALGARLLDDESAGNTSQEKWVWGSATFGALSSMIGAALAAYRAGPGRATGRKETGDEGMLAKARSGFGKLATGTQNLLLVLAGAVIGPLAFVAGALAIAVGAVFARFGPHELAWWLAALSVACLFQGVGDINKWSMHPYYKRRLQSAFGLRRISGGDHVHAEEIPFNVRLEFPTLLDRPKLLVCAAVNVTDYGLVPPGRPVSTFTFCRTEVDAGLLGRVGTTTYATLLGPYYERDFTVPASVAASGAAFSPVMGKMTKPHLRFLMALANLRLGVWLPNPARVQQWAMTLDTPAEPGPAGEPTDDQRKAKAALDAAQAELARVRTEADVATTAVRSALADALAVDPPPAPEVEKALRRDAARGVAEAAARVTAAQLAVERACRAVERADADADRGAPVRQSAFPSVPRPTLLLRELFGRFRADSKFVYVTDGGHYENLGLVELVRRGCTEIYCFDAAGDQLDAFTTLSDAVTIARTELGVEIDVDPSKIEQGDSKAPNQTDHVVGRVFYPGAEDRPGTIVFAKAAVTDDIPPEVKSWRKSNARFPTDGTDDQLYTDQRFEAYRALGAHTAMRAIAAMDTEAGRTPIAAHAPFRLT